MTSVNEGDYMEVDQPVLPFSAYQLDSLSVVTSVDDATSLVEAGLNVPFCNLIAKICAEISVLYGLDESVTEIEDESGIQGFLFDLSAFLGELECPHESITCGPIEQRFSLPNRRAFVFNYLMGEMKSARLFAWRSAKTAQQKSAFPPCVTSALNTLNVPKPSGPVTLPNAVSILEEHAAKRLQAVSQPPKPLFRPASMDAARWKQVESVARALGQDCRSRHLLLLKRMDVTVNSFLWSDRVRKRDAEIRTYYTEQRDRLAQLAVPGISALISASEALLEIEQASSKRRREHTKSRMKPEALSTAPADRGGRTDDIHGLRNETFQEQSFNEGNRGRGGFRGGRGGGYRGGHDGGHRGGRGGGGGRGGFQQSHEHMVRQEYQDRTFGRGGYENGRGQQGRGGFRGGRGH